MYGVLHRDCGSVMHCRRAGSYAARLPVLPFGYKFITEMGDTTMDAKKAALEKTAAAQQAADVQVDPLRIVCHAVDQQIRDNDPALQLILQSANLPPDSFNALGRVKLTYLALGGRLRRYAALYGREDDTVRLRPATYDVNQYLRGITNLLDRQLGIRPQGEVVFKSRTAGSLCAVFDADRLSAILFNLVDNAIRHGHTDNKNVYISLRETANTFIISVKDKGRGVQREQMQTLFAQYAHLPAVPSAYPSQLEGLGLALCQKYAHEMGGKLTFENQKVGTKFSLTLPKRPAEGQQYVQEVRAYQPDRMTMLLYLAPCLLALKTV